MSDRKTYVLVTPRVRDNAAAAVRYGVTQSNISNIVRRKSWRHVA